MQNLKRDEDLVIALFKEYLMLAGYPETLEKFKEELMSKRIETSIEKRSEMVEILNLKEEALEEEAKKEKGEPFIKSTLELLIREYLRKQEGAIEPHTGNTPKIALKTYSQERPEFKKKIIKKVMAKPQIQALPQAKEAKAEEPATDSIWSGTSITGKRSSLPSIKSSESNEISLPDFIGETSSLQNFYMVLFHDKRVKAIPDNWYEALYNLKPGSSIDLADYQTWGIHEEQGGPCGFIAVIQARAIKYIFFGDKAEFEGSNLYENSVLQAIYDTFKQISEDSYYFVIPKQFYAGTPTCDFIIQEMANYMVVTVTNLYEFLDSSSFRDYCFSNEACSFIPAIVVSLVLTRGIDAILEEDFDAESQSSLFSNCNNASQELVNLMITGRATAGLHNGVEDVGGMELKGVRSPCDIGVVSIFEYHGYMKVGSFLREDIKFPIYVCFNEAHFTVLFSLNRRFQDVSRREGGTVEMVYIDQLGDEKDMYALSVEFNTDIYVKYESDSFVENLLETLLPVTAVDWKGKEKLL